MAKLESDFTDYKEKYHIHIGILTKLREKEEKMAKLTAERTIEKNNLEDMIDALETAVAPTKDDTDG